MFSDLIQLKKQLQKKQHESIRERVLVGKICYIDDNFAIRVKPLNEQNSYVSYWLQPSTVVKALEPAIGDIAFYFYNGNDYQSGYYFDLLSSDSTVFPLGLTEAEVNALIDIKITAYNLVIQEWVTINFVSELAFSNTLADYTTLVQYQLSIVNAYRYITQLNLSNGGGNFAVAMGWINRVVTFLVTGVTGRHPAPISGTPTAIDYTPSNYVIQVNAAVNGNTVVGDNVYFRFDTQYKHYIQGIEGVTINGSTTTFLMSPLQTWRLTKTAGATFTLTQVSFNIAPY